MVLMALISANGYGGTEVSAERSQSYWRAAAAAGHPRALATQASQRFGEAKTQADRAEAITLTKRAAEAGSAWGHIMGLAELSAIETPPDWEQTLTHLLIGYRLAVAGLDDDMERTALARIPFAAQKIPAEKAVIAAEQARKWDMPPYRKQ